MHYQHGGDVYSYTEQFKNIPIDFSSNINPRGIPKPVQTAMKEAVNLCIQYPDPYCRQLRTALAGHWGMKPENFFCANGAAEIFYRFVYSIKPRTALLTAPTFGEYEAALGQVDCQIRFHVLEENENFQVTSRTLEDITPDLDIVILCNPNNPTGCTIQTTLLTDIIKTCQKNDVWLMLDECFCDFLVNADEHSACSWIMQYHKLIIGRAFTKMYAVPGVRLGWCMTTNLALLDMMYQAGQPWSVSVIAQHCGCAALSCTGWEHQSAQWIAKMRQWLYSALQSCGLRVFPGEANYLLFYCDVLELKSLLMHKGILIRSCENYRGLGQGYFRVAVKSLEDNQKLIQAIQEVLTDAR